MSAGLRIGVVGCGAMGRNHVRLLTELAEADLIGVYDSESDVSSGLALQFGTRLFDSMAELASEVEAVVLAVPTVLHADIGCALLDQGVHLLVEKPIAPSLDEADRLIASAAGKVLAVGHVEFFNPAVEALLDQGSSPRFVVVERLSSFTPRSLDVDVVLDLMIHDLQILQALDESPLVEVRAVGIAVLSERIDIADARLEFESGCVANVTASRISVETVRCLRAFLEDRYLSLDYREQSLAGFHLEPVGGDASPQNRMSPVEVPIERQEPLRRELERFIAACRGADVRYVDGIQGRRALACAHRILEAIK